MMMIIRRRIQVPIFVYMLFTTIVVIITIQIPLVHILVFVTCLSVVVDNNNNNTNNTYQYNVQDTNGNILFTGGTIAFFMYDKWCVYNYNTTITTDDDNNNNNNNNSDIKNHTENDNKETDESESTGYYWKLILVHREKIIGIEPTLGSYTGERVTWSCQVTVVTSTDDSNYSMNDDTISSRQQQHQSKSVTIITQYKNIVTIDDNNSSNAIVFEVIWPDGVIIRSTCCNNIRKNETTTTNNHQENNINLDNYTGSITTFPSLLPSKTILPNMLSWYGSFIQLIHDKYPIGSQSGPIVFYNSYDTRVQSVIIGTPYNYQYWKSYTSSITINNNNTYWTPGTSRRIKQIPTNYTQSILLYQRKQPQVQQQNQQQQDQQQTVGGITATLSEWGTIMQESRKEQIRQQQNLNKKEMSKNSSHVNVTKLYDVTINKIGYQTDNGAMYCFCTDTNCSQTLLNVISYLRSIDIPIGYLSFQGSGASTSTMTTSSHRPRPRPQLQRRRRQQPVGVQITSNGRQRKTKSKAKGMSQRQVTTASAPSLAASAPWCIHLWGVDGGLSQQYPMNLSSFQQALNIPLQLYAPYFCRNSSYFSNTSTDTNTIGSSNSNTTSWISIKSDPTLPECNDFDFENVHPDQSKEFYNWFLLKGMQNGGMISFESDFMNQNYNCVPDFITNVSAADIWQHGMANAAYENNIGIQWCYATPTDVFASIDMQSVTNFRVSDDYCYGTSWDIGDSSLLVWALGSTPSKDTLWTTNNNHTSIHGCPWTADHENDAAELHVVLALMSTGPVGVSDSIGNTNATLLKRIIMKDGTLLKPSKPVTSIDSTFIDRPDDMSSSTTSSPLNSTGTVTSNIDGYVYGTYCVNDCWIFVSFLLSQPVTLRIRDFWPPLNDASSTGSSNFPITTSTVVGYRTFSSPNCTNNTNPISTGCIKINHIQSINDITTSVFVITNTTSYDSYVPTVTTVWQPCVTSRWFVLGELDKYVSLSPIRFQSITCTTNGVTCTVTGPINETVVITALQPSSNRMFGTSGVLHDPSDLQYTVVRRTIHFHENFVPVRIEFVTPTEQASKEYKQ